MERWRNGRLYGLLRKVGSDEKTGRDILGGVVGSVDPDLRTLKLKGAPREEWWSQQAFGLIKSYPPRPFLPALALVFLLLVGDLYLHLQRSQEIMAATIRVDSVEMSGSGESADGNGNRKNSYDVRVGAQTATSRLLETLQGQLPPEILHQVQNVQLTSTSNGSKIYFPCPFKETEAIVALKSLEACVVAALGKTRYGDEGRKERAIAVDIERSA